MNLRKLYYLMLIIPLFFFYTGCSESTDPPVTVNEAEVLVKHIEADNNPITNIFVQPNKMIKASDVYDNIDNDKYYVIDLRTETDYNNGHIEGAIRVASGEVLAHYKANNLQDKDVVVIVCVSGQTAGWVSGLLHTAGYTNSKDMKWGMCSWNPTTSGAWTGDNVNSLRESDFVSTATAKPEAGDLPTLSTGKTAAADILNARVEAIFAEGFGAVKLPSETVYGNLSGYQIVNFWKPAHYVLGHIDGAIQYSPGESLAFETDLKTLSKEKPVAVYCYTGQTSAHVAAYLRVLGYDAKSILYGVNGMAYDMLPANKFVEANEVHDYPLVK